MHARAQTHVYTLASWSGDSGDDRAVPNSGSAIITSEIVVSRMQESDGRCLHGHPRPMMSKLKKKNHTHPGGRAP